MFKAVELHTTDDPRPLTGAGVVVRQGLDSHRRGWEQPCAAFQQGCCSIYPERPSVCRAYRCELLTSCDTGKIALGDAEKVIADATALRDRIRPALQTMLGSDVARLDTLTRRAVPELQSMSQRRDQVGEDAQDLLFDIVALEILLARHFREPVEPGQKPPSAAAIPRAGEYVGDHQQPLF